MKERRKKTKATAGNAGPKVGTTVPATVNGITDDHLKQRIVDAIRARQGKQFRRRELFLALHEPGLDYGRFKEMLDALEARGELDAGRGRAVTLPEPKSTGTGVFIPGRRGGGRVRLPDGTVVAVRLHDAGAAMPGDTVQVRITRKGHPGAAASGMVTRVLGRSTAPVIGIFETKGGVDFVIPRGDGFPHRLPVPPGAAGGAEPGNLVACRLMEMPGTSLPHCSVVEVLGDPEAPGVDVLAILKRFDLPAVFPDAVIRESEAIPDDLGPEVIARRRDCRTMVICTIDPIDAKDFDDALSLVRLPEGGWELGVHIADVAHYVADGSAMDIEAIARGMSCYLVDRVIPMLPERLSNGLCSLKPDVDRLTKSVFARIAPDGAILSAESAETVIHSRARLSYEQVQAYLDGTGAFGAENVPPEVGAMLRDVAGLTKLLVDKRTERGAIDMDIPEARVMLDDRGKPIAIERRERFLAHRMVEEAMLLANTVVAQLLGTAGLSILYRIHDGPDPLKLKAFAQLSTALGHTFNYHKGLDPHYLQAFLGEIAGTRYVRVLNSLLLRTMAKAAYSPRNIGHFGLALREYAHFTSPIRRYPDLVVHRQLAAFLAGGGRGTMGADNGKFVGARSDDEKAVAISSHIADTVDSHEPDYYDELGNQVTRRELVTDAAERESVRMKTAEYMHRYLGDTFAGMVTSVMPNGMFVELDTVFAEGLVHVSSLDDDYYQMDKDGIALVGMSHGRVFRIGDRVTVQVASADKLRGEVDFILVGTERKETRTVRPRKFHGGRSGGRGRRKRR